MDSIKDLLIKKDLDQPSEMKSIQDFLQKEFRFDFILSDHPEHHTLTVASGKIAYELRTLLPRLDKYAAPTKKIYIRIKKS